MEIKKYLKVRGNQSALALALGESPAFVNKIAKGEKQVPLEWCAKIEVATKGQVTRRDLRPKDWQIHWPELAHKASQAKVR